MSATPRVTIEFYPSKVAQRFEVAGDRAQMFLDNEVLRTTAPYVPRVTGHLERSGIAGTRIGTGLVVYNAIYAKPQYEGKFKHSTQAHPKATGRWFEVSKAANLSAWLRGVKKIGGGEPHG